MMTRSIQSIAASLAVLCSLSGAAVFAQSPKPAASPSPAAKTSKMGGSKMSGKMSKMGSHTAKSTKGSKMSGKMTKKTPARDPKTGRFVKASPSPAPSAKP